MSATCRLSSIISRRLQSSCVCLAVPVQKTVLGIDHERLTVRHNGIDRRLTDVHGEVIRELLA